MSTIRSASAIAVGTAILMVLAGCSAGGDDAAPAKTTGPDMSEAQRKATLPGLTADAETAAGSMLESIAAGDLDADSNTYLEAHPLDEHHHLGKWEITKRPGYIAGTVCVEYRPTEDADPVAMSTYNVTYSAAEGSMPESKRSSPAGTGLNTGC
ncbi:hypothetical protein [Curtobacterium sp. PhB115]|uniref:hypothetical protein n=1 Tax=Curtobacterium sp. PhB115 TaxID=2485173 RepID=UPI000F4BE9F1|nr:hypothetical protein [Curtobacterium sp. PhB115]ROP72227.1 hypothetical protein EDF19_1240 [Curtobacterium sp. PhB115]